MKEFDDDAGLLDENMNPSNGLSASSGIKKKPDDYVRAPSDPALRNAPCPIDQEPFRSEWSEEVQDFIWKDAIRVGNRFYHASCYREATKDRDKDGGATPVGAGTGRTGTPDSVLGKRKAEVRNSNQI
jgi:pre-mRNA cleavage complex 2 protein Pcf11